VTAAADGTVEAAVVMRMVAMAAAVMAVAMVAK